MPSIDIRVQEACSVDRIIYGDGDFNCLVKGNPFWRGVDSHVYIVNKGEELALKIEDQAEAQYLIAALQKAIQLGWFD